MEVLDFINSNENWEEILTGDPWHIRVSRDGDYALLKYNQLDSDFSLNIVRECRGAIFYKNDDGKYECVCRALNKFGNYGEAYVPNIDWDSVVVEEKVDGILEKMWYHNGQWHFSTNGMIDAFKATYDDLESSFGDLVKEALADEDNMQSLLDSFDKNCTYMFELVSPKVQMTCYYPETKLYYLGQRDMRTMKESKEYTEQMKLCGVLTPKIYPLTTLEECLSYIKGMTKDEEGFVIKDKNFNRMKLKSPQYLMAFHMNNNGAITTKRIIKIMKNNMLDDFVAYCPQYQEQVDEVVKMIELIAQDLNNTWAQTQKVYSENRKEFAENICKFKYQDYIWARYDGWFDNATDYIMNMTNNRIVRLIKQKKNEVGC